MITSKFGLNPAAFARSPTAAPSQAQINAQIQNGGGSAYTRDAVVRTNQRRDALRAVGHASANKKMLDKAGVTKVAARKGA